MKTLLVILLASLVLLSACTAPASVPPTATGDSASQADSRITELEKELKAKEEAIAKLQQQMQEQQRRLDALTPPPPPVPLAPARFVLAELTITPAAVKTGEVVTISIEVSNTGGTEGSYTLVFQVERLGKATAVKNMEVTLKAGQTKTVAFTTTVDVIPQDTLLDSLRATYQVNVNGKVGQFTVTAPTPAPPTPAPPTPAPPTPEELEAKQVITDLAYIKVSAWPYSDDADPEYEGVSITVSYYDSKSKSFTPSGVSVEVTVELYWYTNYPSIYQKRFIVEYPDYSGLPLLLGEVVRIPYKDIQTKPSGMTRGPILILTVSTPKQGTFKVQDTISGFVWP